MTREAFEKWAKDKYFAMNFSVLDNGEYDDDNIESMWIGYQQAVEHCKQGEPVAHYAGNLNGTIEFKVAICNADLDLPIDTPLFAHAMPKSEAEQRMLHDYPKLLDFFTKYAMGRKIKSSCFKCGSNRNNPAITHLELPDIYICDVCEVNKTYVGANEELKKTTLQPTTDISEWKTKCEKLEAMVDKLLDHCPDGECLTCGSIVCPDEEPLHFHHDGCPACAQRQAHRESLT
ncbi:hypothetical protein ACFQ2T_05100 [Methylophilus flavus]|uniref:Uncharacterized protein n=1 Tax=Methylophilus flavus TaxID=640084 RepID=A0ABW3PC95_9PROT